MLQLSGSFGVTNQLSRAAGHTVPFEAAYPFFRPPDDFVRQFMRNINLLVIERIGHGIGITVVLLENLGMRSGGKAEDRTVTHLAVALGPVVNDAERARQLKKRIQRAGNDEIKIQKQRRAFQIAQLGREQGHLAPRRHPAPFLGFRLVRHVTGGQGLALNISRNAAAVFGKTDKTVRTPEVARHHGA